VTSALPKENGPAGAATPPSHGHQPLEKKSMNVHTDSTAAAERQDAIIASLMSEACSAVRAIRVTSKYLADLMEEIHGQKCRVHVDHDVGFILIGPV
jgi:hypothetical protein